MLQCIKKKSTNTIREQQTLTKKLKNTVQALRRRKKGFRLALSSGAEMWSEQSQKVRIKNLRVFLLSWGKFRHEIYFSSYHLPTDEKVQKAL